MPKKLKRLDQIKDCILTFVCIGDKGQEIRNINGRLEPSPNTELFGYRFRFEEEGRKGNIGMIFPEGRNSQHGDEGANRIYRENGILVLEFAVRKCPGINGCCQPWNNYVRYLGRA